MIAYDRLSQIIPPDQALANKALAVALSQISNIKDVSVPGLASAYKNIATVSNLNLLENLTQPLPNSVIQYYNTNYATGSGPGNTLVITDLLGAASGTGYIQPFDSVTGTIQILTNNGTLANLITIYGRISNTVNSVYGPAASGPIVIPAGFGAGTYADADTALATALIPAAVTEVGNVVAANAAATANLNTQFNSMAAKLIAENTNLTLADIDPGSVLGQGTLATQGFVQSVISYAPDIQKNGPAEFIEQVADTTTLGGQALIASMRQARNDIIFSQVNIVGNGSVDSGIQANLEIANLTPSVYSSQQAANLIV